MGYNFSCVIASDKLFDSRGWGFGVTLSDEDSWGWRSKGRCNWFWDNTSCQWPLVWDNDMVSFQSILSLLVAYSGFIVATVGTAPGGRLSRWEVTRYCQHASCNFHDFSCACWWWLNRISEASVIPTCCTDKGSGWFAQNGWASASRKPVHWKCSRHCSCSRATSVGRSGTYAGQTVSGCINMQISGLCVQLLVDIGCV